jgi:hypothetical protein
LVKFELKIDLVMSEIVYINERKGMAVVEVESNLCSVIELLEDRELNLGDPVQADFKKEGPTTMFNHNTHEEINIVVQNTILSKDDAIRKAVLA